MCKLLEVTVAVAISTMHLQLPKRVKKNQFIYLPVQPTPHARGLIGFQTMNGILYREKDQLFYSF